mgnify:CR=1 FL=1
MKNIIISMVTLLTLSGCAVIKAPIQSNEEVTYLTSGSSSLPFSEAVKVGSTLYLSGQIGLVPGTGKLAQGGIEAETKQTMDNIVSVLNKYDYNINDVVKCAVMLTNIKEWPDFNKVYRPYFEKHFPARSAFAASGLALNAKVEVECIAVKQ